jgi:hypothetical protein
MIPFSTLSLAAKALLFVYNEFLFIVNNGLRNYAKPARYSIAAVNRGCPGMLQGKLQSKVGIRAVSNRHIYYFRFIVVFSLAENDLLTIEVLSFSRLSPGFVPQRIRSVGRLPVETWAASCGPFFLSTN